MSQPVLSESVKKTIGRFQQNLLDKKCPLCRSKAKVEVLERKIKAYAPGKLDPVYVYKRFTHVTCKKCKSQTLFPFSPKTRLLEPSEIDYRREKAIGED
jgi:hypothetical protein